MKAVWKYDVPAHDGEPLMMQAGAQIVCAAWDPARPAVMCVWAVVDPAAEKDPVILRVVGTGWEFQDGAEWVGTVVGSPFVWHVLRLSP